MDPFDLISISPTTGVGSPMPNTTPPPTSPARGAGSLDGDVGDVGDEGSG